MFLNAFKSFRPAYKLILKDKVSLLLAMIPLLIGIILYYFLGRAFYSSILSYGTEYIEQYLSNGAFGEIVYYLIVSILTIMLYFIVNWTFVLVLSLIASPFNDLLSSRIEKLLLNEKLPDFGESIQNSISKILPTLLNEAKKIFIIITLSLLALVLGYIPILTPLSVFVTVLLLAAGFVDYSWARHGIHFKGCLKDIRANMLSYGIGGGFFMVLVAIPLVNIIVPSFATSYFTVLWVKNNEHRN